MAKKVENAAKNIKNQLNELQLDGIKNTIVKNLTPFYKKNYRESPKNLAKKLYDEISAGYVTRGRALSHVEVVVTDGKNKFKESECIVMNTAEKRAAGYTR